MTLSIQIVDQLLAVSLHLSYSNLQKIQFIPIKKIKNGFKLIPEVGQSWQLSCMGLGTASSHFSWCIAPAPSRQHPASWSVMQPQQGAHRISCLEKIPVIFCNFLYYSLTRQSCLFQRIKDMLLILCFIKWSLGEGNIKI